MTTQVELQKLAQARNDLIFEGAFVDASRCEVCGDKNVKYIERPNGVIISCPSCEEYIKRFEN